MKISGIILLIGLVILGVYNNLPLTKNKVKYELCGQIFYLDELRSQKEQAKGLMNIKELKDNEGAIFINEKPKEMSFWMKNTLIPLDIGFFMGEDLILHHSMKTQIDVKDSDLKRYGTRPYEVTSAVEVNIGFFDDKYPCKLKKLD